MTETKHTPGPWNIHPHYSLKPLSAKIGDEDFNFLNLPIAQGVKLICVVKFSTKTEGGWPSVENLEEMIANANLIAAAPELLKSLKEILRILNAPFMERGDEALNFAMVDAKNIINKAEGRSE